MFKERNVQTPKEESTNASLQEIIIGIGSFLNSLGKAVSNFVSEHQEEITAFVEHLENFEEIHCGIWKESAENGWFPNWFMDIGFEAEVLKGQKALDDYMSEEIRSSTTKIQEKLNELYPSRAHILDVAFQLHNSQNYIASIPLLLSQTDGICAQKIGSYLFTEHDKRIIRIKEIIEKSPEKSIVLAPLLQNTQFGASIGMAKQTSKDKAPNRSGILHGSRKHLDYGTEINSLKCISLLAYVANILEDE